jgi:hypothetical protein
MKGSKGSFCGLQLPVPYQLYQTLVDLAVPSFRQTRLSGEAAHRAGRANKRERSTPMRSAVLLLTVWMAGCGSSPEMKTDAAWADVRLRGQVDPQSTPPNEVRVLLDPAYRRANCGKDNVITGFGAPGNSFTRASINEGGSFTSKPFVVSCKRRMFGKLAPPTFFVSFDNERDVFYAIGEQAAAVQWRTYNTETKELTLREESCWRIVAGNYTRPTRRSMELNIIIRENPSSPKECRETNS